MKNLRDKITDKTQPVIFYELLPPTDHEIANIDAYIDCSIDLLTSTPVIIDAVNIPEIRPENHESAQSARKYVPKMNPGVFAGMLVKAAYNHLEVVLNHCTVYETWKEQQRWIDEVIQLHKINFLILVGGSTSQTHYPGPTVLEMSDYINAHHQQNIFCGGITIQTRRYHDLQKDEPFRMLTKGLHGIEYFTSQIIYEPVSIKLLIRDYARLCQEQNVLPKRIFLSFAPVSTPKDLQFLRWLGVSVPKTVEQELLKADIGIGWRSIKIAVNILQEILNFMRDEDINVPLGINIEHIARHNFELSYELIGRMGKLYNHFMKK